jgi:endonuclease/exonuclease/phosphatase family metal-dependent hydrolase
MQEPAALQEEANNDKTTKNRDKAEDLRVRTVGTYNILHPEYALSYREVHGLTFNGSSEDWKSRKGNVGYLDSSNWEVDRCVAIKDILLQSYLDIYLLQEVGEKEMDDLLGCVAAPAIQKKGGQYAQQKDVPSQEQQQQTEQKMMKKDKTEKELKLTYFYGHVHSLHMPDRTDGLAVLWKKQKYDMIYHMRMIHPNGKISLIVKLWDKLLHQSLFVVCLHLHWRGGESMASQLRQVMAYVADLKINENDCMGVIVGGDFNYVYNWNPHEGDERSPLDLMIEVTGGMQVAKEGDNGDKPTCNRRKLDWIFWKVPSNAARVTMWEEINHRWAVAAVERTREVLASSYMPPSDHIMTATAFVVVE